MPNQSEMSVNESQARKRLEQSPFHLLRDRATSSPVDSSEDSMLIDTLDEDETNTP